MTTTQSDITIEREQSSVAGSLLISAYRLFACFGLFSIFAALAWGFRFGGAGAAAANYGWNLLLYGVFIIPHLIMTRSWWKRAVWKNPAGTPAERRVYITITVLAWGAVLWFHQPVPGVAIELAWPWMTIIGFTGMVLLFMFTMMFFEGVTRPMLDGLLGVPGSVSAYSHGPETPLFTEGPYAEVRHPMYRAAVLAGLSSLLIHPNTGQLFWAGLIGLTFILFIPVEEAQMIRARGDDYRAYREQTRWRLFRGIW